MTNTMITLRKFRHVLWGIIIGVTLGFGASELWHRDRSGLAPAATEAARAAISADFELVDHTGKVATDEDFRGRWLLVFFGFTHCPDVCPTGLATIARVMDELGPEGEAVQPLFVSIDPERDIPEAMAEFVSAFHPRIVGLTGATEAVATTAKNFRVYYERVEDASSPDGYAMEHTASVYLIDPEGRFVKTYSYNTTSADITDDLRRKLKGKG